MNVGSSPKVSSAQRGVLDVEATSSTQVDFGSLTDVHHTLSSCTWHTST